MTDSDNWVFVYEKNSKEFPTGYYLYTPTGEKYSFEQGIQDKVSADVELYIYNTWWLENS